MLTVETTVSGFITGKEWAMAEGSYAMSLLIHKSDADDFVKLSELSNE